LTLWPIDLTLPIIAWLCATVLAYPTPFLSRRMQLGMAHEQSRPDRDTYVTVNTNKVNTAGAGQFDVNHQGDIARP
jgi:hypothetical protein